MAFTTWAAFRTTLLDAIQSHVEGQPMTGDVSLPDGTRIRYNSVDDARKWLEFADFQIAKETAGSRSSRVSYGQHRRFR